MLHLLSCLERGLRVSDDQDYSVRIQVLTHKEFKNPDKFDHGSISTKSISTVRQFDEAGLACPSRLYPICVRSEALASLPLVRRTYCRLTGQSIASRDAPPLLSGMYRVNDTNLCFTDLIS